jgi:hypothetical protein
MSDSKAGEKLMTADHRAPRRLRHVALRAVVALAVAATVTLPGSTPRVSAQAATPRTFATPEEAVQALLKAAKEGNADDLLALFGPSGKDLVASSDPVATRRNRQVFTVAAREKWVLTDQSANRKTLVIGNEDWPFPVPLVKDPNGWRFDTAAGKEEVVARRIGSHELAAIETSRAYVTAQMRYAQQGHDGQPPGIYAIRFRSDPGKQNGLYWPTQKGEKRSPLGDLVASASDEGYRLRSGERTPLNGYYFKILTGQGRAAAGGQKSYIVQGAMSRGFALVAWPETYDVTGVMTFLVNQDGVVYQKDLGPNTATTASKMTAYNPDSSWQRVD